MTLQLDRRRLLDSVVLVILVVGTLVFVRLAITGPNDLQDLDRFEDVTGVEIGPQSAFFASGLNGDGATFAIVAQDPFGEDVSEALRVRSYRYLRVGYPWLATIATLGMDQLVLLGLAVVGFLAAGMVAWVASRLHETRGAWAWLLIANPALILGVVGDTAESVALALLAVAIYSASDLIGMSVAFVRPTYLVGLARRWPVLLVGLSFAAVGKAYWSWHFGESLFTGGFTVTWPLSGILQAPTLLGWMVVLAGVATAVVGAVRKDLSWVISGAFVLCFGAVVLDTPTNAVRAAGYLPVLWAFGPGYRANSSLRELFSFRLRGKVSLVADVEE